MGVFAEFPVTILFSVGAATAGYFCAQVFLHSNSKALQSLRIRFSHPLYWLDRACVLFLIAYVLVFLWLYILKYLSLNTGIDIGQYNQLIWNSLHGNLLEGTYVPDAPVFLGKSFVPILIALVPLYTVWSDPIVLAVVQILAVAVSAIPLYWIARDRLGRGFGFVCVVIYCLSPASVEIVLGDFHEFPLETLFLAFAMYFLLRRHDLGFIVCLGLALLTKEEVAFIAVGLGIYLLVIQKKRRLGLSVSIFGLVWGVVLLQGVIPFFRGKEYGSNFYYFDTGAGAGGAGRYGYLGHSVAEIASTLITRPDIVMQHLFVPEKIAFVLQLLAPTALIPVMGLEIALLALPTFGYTLLSDFPYQHSLQGAFYIAPLLPFIYFALVAGLRRVVSWQPGDSSKVDRRQNGHAGFSAREFSLAVLVLAATGASYYLDSPGPLARKFDPSVYALNARDSVGWALASQIPRNAIVVAQNEWETALSGRRSVYRIEDTTSFRRADYLFADIERGWYGLRKDTWDYWLSSGYFEILERTDGFILAKRREPDRLLEIEFDDQLALIGCLVSPPSKDEGGKSLNPVLVWRAKKGIASNYQILVRIEDSQGHVWAEQVRLPDSGFTPTNTSEAGKPVADIYTLALRPTIPGGDYSITLSARKADGESELVARDKNGTSLGTDVTIAHVEIVKDKNSYQAGDLWWIEQPYHVDMQEMRLIGFVPPPSATSRGDTLSVGVYWRAREKPQGDYEVAVQLRDATGLVKFEQVSRPANGAYPTTLWNAGEVLLDWHDFVLPQNLALGEYQVYTVLRDGAQSRILGEARISSVMVSQ